MSAMSGGYKSHTMEAPTESAARLTAPAAERNKMVIAEHLASIVPAARGDDDAPRALECASGTGQHVAHFAAA